MTGLANNSLRSQASLSIASIRSRAVSMRCSMARQLATVRANVQSYPGARQKIKHILQAEERVHSGEAPIVKVKPRVIRQASPITEERIERYQARTRAPWRWWR